MKKTKKNVLGISLAYVIYVGVILSVSYFCHTDWCDIQEDGPFGIILYLFLPLLPIFLLSLITYKMHDQVFRAWWNFAWWWSIIIVAVILVLNLGGHNGGLGISGSMSSSFDALVVGLLYFIFVIVSLVKIVHAYNKK